MHELRTEITAEDVSAWERYMAERAAAGGRRRSFAVLVVVWGTIAVLFTWLYTTTKFPPGYILSCGLGIALGLVLAAWVGSASSDVVPQRVLPLAGELTYVIADGVLQARSAGWELSVRREAIRSLAETAEHFFIDVEPRIVLIVPKRSFVSAEEAAAFKQYVG